MNYKAFPQIDKLINQQEFTNYPKYLVKHLARSLINELKQSKKQNITHDLITNELLKRLENTKNQDILPLINATGVVLHTNLGRSLIDEDIYEKCKDIICSYTNLEFDLENGKRGNRYDIVCKNIAMLFGCEDALVVNNNAAAVFLILNTFSKNKYSITSRRELVEIGGSFRVNEVMESSGAKLYEVGTSNKTNIKDYEKALKTLENEEKIIIKTHKSNFYQEGFVDEVDAISLCKFCKQNNVKFYYDLGGGSVDRLKGYKEEPSIKELVDAGVNLLSFSGDKLFASVQSGIILGSKKDIDELKSNQILRMLRVSKIEIAMLNESVKKYLQGQSPISLQMINNDAKTIEKKAIKTFSMLNKHSQSFVKISPTTTLAGAGSTPKAKFDSFAFEFCSFDVFTLQNEFRGQKVIGKIINKKFYLDFKSIKDNECEKLANITNDIIDKLSNK